MGLESLLATLERHDSVTPVTSITLGDVTPKPAWIKGCTSVTPVTSQNDVMANDATTTDGRPEMLLDRQREARRWKVTAMLEAAPGMQRAIYTDTGSDPDNVILTVALRNLATCEMLIPKSKYDSWRLLELIERLDQTTH